MPVIPVIKVLKENIIFEKGAEEEERHKQSLTQKSY
jgi:hypothetical protein